jgi:hypothetical protein
MQYYAFSSSLLSFSSFQAQIISVPYPVLRHSLCYALKILGRMLMKTNRSRIDMKCGDKYMMGTAHTCECQKAYKVAK